MKIFSVLLTGVIFFASCEAYKAINLSSISIGMTKEAVIEKMGKKPDNLIGAKQYPSGIIEVLQYSKYEAWQGTLQERYWLYFWNDTLKQWGRPGDWQREADRVYELRLK